MAALRASSRRAHGGRKRTRDPGDSTRQADNLPPRPHPLPFTVDKTVGGLAVAARSGYLHRWVFNVRESRYHNDQSSLAPMLHWSQEEWGEVVAEIGDV